MATSEHLTLSLFEGELQFSPSVFPARTSASQEIRSVLTAIDRASGFRVLELSRKSDLALSSLRTYLISELSERTQCWKDWKRQATPQGRSWWVLTTSGPRIEESGFGLWPNATCNTVSGGGNHLLPSVQAGKHGLNLLGAAQAWPTRRANKTEGYSSLGFRETLSEKATAWPTPTKQDCHNLQGNSQEERNSPPLNADVRLWPKPKAAQSGNKATKYSPSELNGTHGLGLGACASEFPTLETDTHFLPPETTSEVGLLLSVWTPPQHPVLSVKFTTALMGFPLDWFDGVEQPETRSSKVSEMP